MLRPQHKYPYLYTEVSAIHVVTQEQIASLRWVTANLEQLHKVEILSMNVTANGDRGVHLQQVWLFAKELGTLSYNEKCLLFGKASLPVEVLLKEMEVWLVGILL